MFENVVKTEKATQEEIKRKAAEAKAKEEAMLKKAQEDARQRELERKQRELQEQQLMESRETVKEKMRRASQITNDYDPGVAAKEKLAAEEAIRKKKADREAAYAAEVKAKEDAEKLKRRQSEEAMLKAQKFLKWVHMFLDRRNCVLMISYVLRSTVLRHVLKIH